MSFFLRFHTSKHFSLKSNTSREKKEEEVGLLPLTSYKEGKINKNQIISSLFLSVHHRHYLRNVLHEFHHNVFCVLIQIVFCVLKENRGRFDGFCESMPSNLVLPVLMDVCHDDDRLRHVHDNDDDGDLMKFLIDDELRLV